MLAKCFIVAYNNGYRSLHSLPMRCNASEMFATANVNSCTTSIRKGIIIFYHKSTHLGIILSASLSIAMSTLLVGPVQNRLWLWLLDIIEYGVKWWRVC